MPQKTTEQQQKANQAALHNPHTSIKSQDNRYDLVRSSFSRTQRTYDRQHKK
jgi:hypothetical protein